MTNDLPVDAVKYEGVEVRIILGTLQREENNFCSEYCNLANNSKNPRTKFCPFSNEARPLRSLGAINSHDDSPRKGELFNNETLPVINGETYHEGIAIPRLKGTILLYPAGKEPLVYIVGEVKNEEVLDAIKSYSDEIHEEISKALGKD